MSIPWETVEIRECGEPMVDLSEYGIVCEPAYFNMGLSTNPTILVRRSVAEKLAKVELSLEGARLKVWDGFRPRTVQKAIYQKLWEELKVDNPDWRDAQLRAEVGLFVAEPDMPNRVLPHMTGGAVDLTLIDTDGRELDMGTEFDDFTARSATNYSDLSQEARANRMILFNAMLRVGFTNFPEEWWHFGFGDSLSAYLRSDPYAIYGEWWD